MNEPLTSDEPEQLELGVEPALTASLDILVIRSDRRRKTAQARMVSGQLEVRIPARLTKAEEAEMVEHFRAKFENARRTDDFDLETRAAELAARHDLPRPESIRWVTNQNQRWGSCTPAEGSIRISNRLIEFPEWVIDYVIVHELTHLLEYGHTARFWEIANRYPLTERARGFLIAKGWE